jgi:hypothetical protein
MKLNRELEKLQYQVQKSNNHEAQQGAREVPVSGTALTQS